MTTVQRVATSAKGAIGTVTRNWILVLIVLVVLGAASIIYVNTIRDSYVAGANLLVVNGTTRGDPTLSAPDLPSIATGSVVLSRTRAALGLNVSLPVMKKRLSVKTPAYRSSLLRVEYTDSNRPRAIMIVNGIAEQLTRYYREVSTARYDDDLRALDAEMAKQRANVQRSNARSKTATALGSDRSADAVIERYSDLETQRALANAALAGDASRLSSLRVPSSSVRYEVLHSDPMYQELQSTASTSAVQLANARAAYTRNYPGLRELEAKTKTLQTAVNDRGRATLASPNLFSPTLAAVTSEREKTAALVQGDRAKIAALDSLLTVQRARAGAIPVERMNQLDRDAAQAAYLAIASRRAAAVSNRADALSLGSVVVVDHAVSAEAQAGLRKNLLMTLLLAFAFALAIAAAFISEGLNPRLNNVEQIEELYGRPVVAKFGTR